MNGYKEHWIRESTGEILKEKPADFDQNRKAYSHVYSHNPWLESEIYIFIGIGLLGIWKLIEIIIWVFAHLHWGKYE